MMTFTYIAVGYLLICVVFLVLVQKFPRQAVSNPPNWGSVHDTWVEAVDGRRLEVWRVEPDGKSRGIVLLAHGWGRNRDRMVERARVFAALGFTTVMHSARDHGNSGKRWIMSADSFAKDIASVLKWIGEPVLLYGHSAGSAGAIIVAAEQVANGSERVRALFLEAGYTHTQKALRGLYRWFNPVFGWVFGPTVVFLMNMAYTGKLTRLSPARLAPGISIPTLILHGALDRRFPVAYAYSMQRFFPDGVARLFVAPKAGHSTVSADSGYAEAIGGFVATAGL